VEVRCKIGCGCGKRRASKDSRISTANTRAAKMTNQTPLSSEVISQRKIKCKKCTYSIKIRDKNLKKMLKCKKSNRLISAIIRDERFKCPIGKF